jgi:hypothetical protein
MLFAKLIDVTCWGFNISIYSQKQINALASNPESLLNIVDRTPQVDIYQSLSHQFVLE